MLPWKNCRASNASTPCSHLATPRYPISPPRCSSLLTMQNEIATRRKWGSPPPSSCRWRPLPFGGVTRCAGGCAAFNAMKVITVTICSIGSDHNFDIPHRSKRYAAQISSNQNQEWKIQDLSKIKICYYKYSFTQDIVNIIFDCAHE